MWTDPARTPPWPRQLPSGKGILTPFGMLDPATMSHTGNLDLLIGLERVKCWADAQQARILARLCAHPEPLPMFADENRLERARLSADFLEQEVACAQWWSVGVGG